MEILINTCTRTCRIMYLVHVLLSIHRFKRKCIQKYVDLNKAICTGRFMYVPACVRMDYMYSISMMIFLPISFSIGLVLPYQYMWHISIILEIQIIHKTWINDKTYTSMLYSD